MKAMREMPGKATQNKQNSNNTYVGLGENQKRYLKCLVLKSSFLSRRHVEKEESMTYGRGGRQQSSKLTLSRPRYCVSRKQDSWILLLPT